MRRLSCVVLFTFATIAILAARQAPSTGCEPAGPIRFVCGQNGPEDLVLVPGTPWIIASAYGPQGGLYLIDTKAATSTRLYPTADAVNRHDRQAYAACPGPPQGAQERFQTHGLYLKEGQNARHTLYVVHHGSRESVEIFALDASATPLSIAWIGCVVAPDPIGLNAVVALPDGGLAATNFDPRPPAGARGGFSPALLAGENNGEVWEWHAASGWSKVPGSEAAGANGLEISRDGRWYYVAQWGNRSFMRLSRGQTPVVRDEIELGFRVDNVRWAPDGTLLVAGQGGTDNAIFGRGRGAADQSIPTSTIGRIDPETMTYREIINYPTSPQVSAATVAVQVGDELWAGSFRGDRVARYPLAGVR